MSTKLPLAPINIGNQKGGQFFFDTQAAQQTQYPVSENLFSEEDDVQLSKGATLTKFFRCLPAILFYGTVLLIVYWSMFNTFYFFAFSNAFCTIQLLFTTYMTYYAYYAITGLQNNQKKDWYREYTLKMKRTKDTTHYLNWDDITHYVIIPNYKENMSVLCETIGAIAASPLAPTHIIVVLAMEEREQGGEDKVHQLMLRFEGKFKGMLANYHPSNLPGEMPGKSSNEGHAFRKTVVADVRRRQLRTENVCVSICDADSVHHVKHFEALNFKYCTDPHRHTRMYQGPMVNFLNFDTVPASTRLMCTVVTVHELSHLYNYKKNEVLPFSTYAMSFNCARDVGGWDGDYIAEDWHQFLKCYFHYGDKMRVEALPHPVLCYAVEGDTYWQSLMDRFEQAKRHALALIEIPYVLNKFVASFSSNVRPNLWRSLVLIVKVIWPHYIGVAHLFLIVYTPFIIALYNSSWAPFWADSQEIAVVNGPWNMLFQLISILSFITGPIMMSLNAYRLAVFVKGQEMNKWWRFVQYMLDWVLLATITNFFLAMIPSFLASTKMIYRQEFQYVCATKPEALTPMTPLSTEDAFAVVIE